MFRLWNLLGGLLGAAAVALGAYRAHGLSEELTKRQAARTAATALGPVEAAASVADRERDLAEKLGNYDTAVQYLLIHAVAIVLVGVITARRSTLFANLAGLLF